MNISSPGPTERWQEVISEHRSDIMQSVVALKVRLLGMAIAYIHLVGAQ